MRDTRKWPLWPRTVTVAAATVASPPRGFSSIIAACWFCWQELAAASSEDFTYRLQGFAEQAANEDTRQQEVIERAETICQEFQTSDAFESGRRREGGGLV